MWENNKTVVRTHTKNQSQMAWAIISGVAGNRWLAVQADSPDAATNLLMILTMAKANSRRVDVYVNGNAITQATLR